MKEIDLSENNWVCIATHEIEGMRCSQCKQNFELRTYYDYDTKKKTDVVHCKNCGTTYLRSQ
jgi:DNA-directed RNA polymerase subunit RPC12/RpoP